MAEGGHTEESFDSDEFFVEMDVHEELLNGPAPLGGPGPGVHGPEAEGPPAIPPGPPAVPPGPPAVPPGPPTVPPSPPATFDSGILLPNPVVVPVRVPPLLNPVRVVPVQDRTHPHTSFTLAAATGRHAYGAAQIIIGTKIILVSFPDCKL